MTPDAITEACATRAAVLAEIDRQIARLDAAIAIAPPHFDGLAHLYRSKLRALRKIDGDLSYVAALISPNGDGPGIEDAIRQCESGHARFNRKLMGPAFERRAA